MVQELNAGFLKDGHDGAHLVESARQTFGALLFQGWRRTRADLFDRSNLQGQL
jgi:hypothetical protein